MFAIQYWYECRGVVWCFPIDVDVVKFYLQAAAMVETKLKMSDINAAIEVCCLLHERYTEFSDALLENWQKVLLQKKDEKVRCTLFFIIIAHINVFTFTLLRCMLLHEQNFFLFTPQ